MLGGVSEGQGEIIQDEDDTLGRSEIVDPQVRQFAAEVPHVQLETCRRNHNLFVVEALCGHIVCTLPFRVAFDHP